MDTRKKILTPAEAVETADRLRRNGVTLKVATGHFDPLLAEHARRLGRLRENASALMVVVTTPRHPVLPARARAELAAALGVVDYVVLPENDAVDDLLARIPAGEVVREEPGDERLTRDLIRHVHGRQHSS